MKPISKLDALRARYPLVEITEKDGHLRIEDGRGTMGANIADEDLEKRLSHANLRKAVENYLQALYPYLSFGLTDVSNNYEPRFVAGVWIRRLYDYGERFGGVKCADGASTGFSFWFPDDDATEKLSELNAESKKSQEEGYFFCTGCQKAIVKEEYAGYWFATVLCKKCASPEWLRRAQAETYE